MSNDNLARGVAIEQAAQLSDEHFRKSSSPPMSIDWQRMTQAICSLDPDAAQALAAHDAEIERRAREDEAKWWLQRRYNDSGFVCDEVDQRIAALAESQPAPAKKGKK